MGALTGPVHLLRRLRERWRLAREGGPRARRIPARWRREPGALGTRACLFVTLAREGALLPHAIDHARAWHRAGYAVVAVIVADSPDQPIDIAALDFAAGVLQRQNRGYDFGAWAAAIGRLRPWRRSLEVLAIANDSVVGPSAAFPAMLARAEAAGADVVGPLESTEHTLHLQSFVLFFGARALAHPAFRRFWRRVRTGERQYVIDRYELRLRAAFEAAGLTTAALFPEGAGAANPSLTDWRGLVAAGFPYLKIELLRDNPWNASLAGWRDAAVRAGFDLPALDRQLAALQAAQPRRWAIADDPADSPASTIR